MNNSEKYAYKPFKFLGTGGNFKYKYSLVVDKSMN